MPRTIAFLGFEVRDREELQLKWGWIMGFGILLIVTGIFALSAVVTATVVTAVGETHR